MKQKYLVTLTIVPIDRWKVTFGVNCPPAIENGLHGKAQSQSKGPAVSVPTVPILTFFGRTACGFGSTSRFVI